MAGGFVGAYASGFTVFDYHTETGNTAIDEEVPGVEGNRLALVSVNYLCGATAQNMYCLYAKDNAASGAVGSSRNHNGAAVALSGQKDIVCLVAPESPAGDVAAASDIIAFQLTDGTWEFDTVASLSTKTITCTNNITGVDAGGGGTAIAAGARVQIFGVVADATGFVLHLVAATLVNESNTILAWHPYMEEPFYVTNPNATNDSFQNNLIFAHIKNK